MCGQFASKSVGIDVVDERPLAVDLDHREPLAVSRLELRVTTDVDLGEVEPELGPSLPHDSKRPLTEVAALRVVERDARYG